ncbi:helix-turn-helix domain-containing protein [Nonomuraea sp. NBC_00507]|uniref:helix-turn-helix domain-containing protein n=1 Tax=Nonomuraea sp. NBC_00507 TaxID=2976002 RepID=UPI002E17D90F
MPKPTYVTSAPAGLAGVVREAREELGITQELLAGLIGRSQDHVSRFERGWGRTDARTLDRWAHQLGYRWALVPLEASDGSE